MTDPKCPDRTLLVGYALGTISEGEAEIVAEHLETCVLCESTVEQIESQGDSVIRNLRRPPSSESEVESPECQAALAQAEGIVASRSAMAGLQKEVMGEGRLLGQYQLLEKLGQGGMGAVYKARHLKLKRFVALKVLPKGRMNDVRAVARFEREMEAVGRLDHPNIVRAHDACEIDGTHFLVMEYVDGIDLSAVVDRLGPLSIADACEVVRQAALGLRYVHEHSLVHRDVKPSNLILTADGRVKVLDLGLALLSASETDKGELTSADQAMGTADYMAPEQTTDSHSVDIRADIYSLGCTLYKLLIGRAPFADGRYRTAFQKMMAHVNEPVPAVRELRHEISKDLAAILHRMLAKKPDERFATPAEVITAIQASCRQSDLKRLCEAAATTPASPTNQGHPPGSAFDFTSSAEAGTEPRREQAERPSTAATRRRTPSKILLALGLVPLAIFLLAGVIIHFKGQRVEVPDGSEVAISEKGEMTLNLPKTPIPSVTNRSFAPSGDLAVAMRLDALNLDGTDNAYCWLSPDGLTIYWTREKGHIQDSEIWCANRKAPSALFENARRLLFGRQAAFTGDGLGCVLLPSGYKAFANLCWAHRSSPDRPFSERAPIEELRSQPNPKSPWLSADGLTLVFQRATNNNGSEFAVTRRKKRTDRWEAPKPLAMAAESRFSQPLTWPSFSEDGKTLWFSHGGAKVCDIVRATRSDDAEPFGHFEFIASGGRPLQGRCPRYVAASGELFFSKVKSETNGGWELWVARGRATRDAVDTPSQASGAGVDRPRRVADATSSPALPTARALPETRHGRPQDTPQSQPAAGQKPATPHPAGPRKVIGARLTATWTATDYPYKHPEMRVFFRPDGRRVAAVCWAQVTVWDLDGGNRQKRQFTRERGSRGIAWSPDGKQLAFNEQNKLYVWNLETDQCRMKEKAHPINAIIWDIAYSPDGTTIATGADDATVVLWDAKRLELRSRYIPAPDQGVLENVVKEVSFSPDGQFLAACGSVARTSVWATATGNMVAELSKADGVLFSPDSRTLLCGDYGWGSGGRIHWYEVPSWQRLRAAKAHEKVAGLAVSPDAQTIATVGVDDSSENRCFLRFWHAQNGERLAELPLPGYAHSVDFSADGRHLATAGDSMVRLWELEFAGATPREATDTKTSPTSAVATSSRVQVAGATSPRASWTSFDDPRRIGFIRQQTFAVSRVETCRIRGLDRPAGSR